MEEFDQELVSESESLGLDLPKATNNQFDAIRALYNDVAKEENYNVSDPFNMTYHTSESSKNNLFNDEFEQYYPGKILQNNKEEIPILVPEGLRDVLAVDTESSARVCVTDKDEACT